MLRILGRTVSINVRKALWTAEEMSIPFVHEAKWATPDAPATSPEFLALNPNGLVPVIEDDGFVLWELNAICRYLARKIARHDLYPAAPAEAARVDMWMDWQQAELNPAWRYAFMALVRKSAAHADAAQIEASASAWNARMAVLEAQLRKFDYAAGPAFTLADIVLGLSAHRWRSTPIDHAPLPHVGRWMDRLGARPGFRRYASSEFP